MPVTSRFWHYFWASMAILAALVVVATLTLASYAAFQGYARHQEGARYEVKLAKADTDLKTARKQLEAYALHVAIEELQK